MIGRSRRRLFRMVMPKYPEFSVYGRIGSTTTALGPVCVATVASRLPGWEAEVIDENNYRLPGPKNARGFPDHSALQALRPADAVGLYGSLSSTMPRLHELASFYRGQGVLTIAGGHHVDALPEDSLNAGVDVVVHGEGEVAISEILTAWERQRPFADIRGVSFSRDGRNCRTEPRAPIEDFEGLPLPDFGLLRYARLLLHPVGRIRGCGMNCEFCAVKGRARAASPERLLAQISLLAETRGAREFFAIDDHFAQDRAETIRFCRMLRDYCRRTGLKFLVTAQVRLDCARDSELLTTMREAGIHNLAVGIESPIEEELRAMGKRLTASTMTELVLTYHRHGFLVHGMFIFGYPMRPGIDFRMGLAERIERFSSFIRRARLDTVQVALPVPLPGTELRARLEREGRVLPLDEIGWEHYDGNFPLIVPDEPLTPADLAAGSMTIQGRFFGLRRVLGLALHILGFPLEMLPPVNPRERFRRWRRRVRNDFIGTGGYFLLRAWRRQFRKGPFRRKLARLTEHPATRQSPTGRAAHHP